MELRDLIKKLISHKKILIVFALSGLLTGFAIHAYPAKYVSTGSVFIGRITDKNTSFFTYEGYYSQQTALAYSNSIIGLLESSDLIRKTTDSLGIEYNEVSARKLKKDISVTKAGPQVITVNTRGNTAEESSLLWEVLIQNLDEATSQINTQSDPALKIFKISKEPVVKKVYKPLWAYLVVGTILSSSLGVLYITSREYFKEEKNI